MKEPALARQSAPYACSSRSCSKAPKSGTAWLGVGLGVGVKVTIALGLGLGLRIRVRVKLRLRGLGLGLDVWLGPGLAGQGSGRVHHVEHDAE